jgi:hypothetical protein
MCRGKRRIIAVFVLVGPGQRGRRAGRHALKPVPLDVTQVLNEAEGRPARWQDWCPQLLVVETLDDRQRSGSLRVEEVLQCTRFGDRPRLGH